MKIKDNRTMKSQLTVMLITCIISFIGCKDFVEVRIPGNQILGAEVFNNDASATSAITGIYSKMMGGSGFASGGARSLSLITGMSSDEFINYNTSYVDYAANDLQPTTSMLDLYLWNEPYKYIFTANAILEGLAKSNSVSPLVKKQLQGEAHFIRAFCYFYLVNLFGEIPLQLTTDYKVNAVAYKATVPKVYAQIMVDLKEAENLLSSDYITAERVRPNKWTAGALLARTYLYTRDWTNAASKSLELINQTSQYTFEQDIDKVFLKSTRETIWQMLPVNPSYNTNDGNIFILTGKPGTSSISSTLYTSFDNLDKRKTHWVGSIKVGADQYYYPYKYKVRTGNALTEYAIVFRLTEQYLIHAEAEVHLEHPDEALKSINKIRYRAGLANLSNQLTGDEILIAIEKERRVELFSEWGHRWFDLKRTNKANAIIGSLKPGTWKETDVLYPIPQVEIERNRNIGQNNGY